MGSVCASKQETGTETVIDASPALNPVEPEPSPPTEEPPKEPTEPKLSITIVGARGLRNSDWLPGTGKPDCYCELKTGSTTLFTTKIIDNTCEPVWFEKCEVNDIEGDAPLEFNISDKDLIGSDFLGKAILESKDYAEGFNGELKIEKAKTEQAYLKVKVKVEGKDLPAGPPSEFTVTVEKSSKDKSFGLDLDTQGADDLFVVGVKAGGPFLDYNATAQPEYQVKTNDVIVNVNGKVGSMTALLEQFRNETKVECVIRRTMMTSVIFDRGETSSPKGLTFPDKPQGTFLLVKGINGGAAEKHNSTVKEQEKLYPGDRIVSVGAMRAIAPKLKEALQSKEGPVMLTLMRVAPPAGQKESGEQKESDAPSMAHWLFG